MRGQINDGSCTKDGIAYKRMTFAMFRLMSAKFPGVYTSSGQKVFEDGKRHAWITELPSGVDDDGFAVFN